jgi:hypothetical protein
VSKSKFIARLLWSQTVEDSSVERDLIIPARILATLAKPPELDYRNLMTWNDTFVALFEHCVTAYQDGNRDFTTYFSPDDLEFLAGIGCQTREFFDFVEDFCDAGVPSASTALLVAAVRRDYFLTVQKGVTGNRIVTVEDLPTFGDALDGIAYLPRILAKGRAKLRGELDPDVMFGCGGDRHFLKNHGAIHPADFLRRVWAAGQDDRKLAAWVSKQGA